MNKKPFFSIVIPTYNRPQELWCALKSILRQDFNDYEVIITDNSLNSESDKMVKNFSDKRIIYFKNNINIGFNRNLYKGIKLAKGKYIFLLGDDDLILKKDTLNSIYSEIRNHKYGFIRLKFIYQGNNNILFTPYFKNKDPMILETNAPNIEILNYLYNKAIFSHIAGLIFKNDKKIKIKLIESAKGSEDIEISNFWISYLLSSTKSNGAYIDLNHPVIVKWADYNELRAYMVKNGRIIEERILKLLSEYLSRDELIKWKAQITYSMISLFPSIKYYTSRQNLLLYVRRLIELNKQILRNKFFYFSLIVGFCMPKFIWRKIRAIYHNSKIIREKKLLFQFDKLKIEITPLASD